MLFFSEILEFGKHFLRCTQIQRRLVIGIVKSLALHDYTSVYFVLGIKEMHIAGSHNRLVEFITQSYYLFVNLIKSASDWICGSF